MISLAVLMTCYNRREKTVACLKSLFANSALDEILVHAFLVDDGSTDGTSEAVAAQFPDVTVIRHSGNLFWNRGMHMAFNAALSNGFDYYLWLNDDTILNYDALSHLIQTEKEISGIVGREVIVVGSLCDSITGKLTYGGMERPVWWKRTNLKIVEPDAKPIECDTMNGNCVLIPRNVAADVGNLDPRFEHAMGDMDYGLRARMLGHAVWISAGYVGTCSRNFEEGTFKDTNLPLRNRWKMILSTKGLPIKSWRIFTRRHAGPLWPAFWLWPYMRVILSSFKQRRVLK